MAKQEILDVMAELKIVVASTFVPFSRSRNKGEKDRSLNWKIRILVDGRQILETDYSSGVAHCPSYKQGRMTVDMYRAIVDETENGKEGGNRKAILPDPESVIVCLVSDSDVLDHSTFESWAGDLGYDVDSRKAEATYRACLMIALALRVGVGEVGLVKLREACQDY